MLCSLHIHIHFQWLPSCLIPVLGDLLRLTVLRSRPAHGVVSTRWRIIAENSHPPSEQFRRTAGQLYFREVSLVHSAVFAKWCLWAAQCLKIIIMIIIINIIIIKVIISIMYAGLCITCKKIVLFWCFTNFTVSKTSLHKHNKNDVLKCSERL